MDGDDAKTGKALRTRHDGWTAKRQAVFLEQLAGTGSVTEACRAAGVSTTTAYRVYARLPDVAQAWDEALEMRRPMLEDAAFHRAVHGITVPVTRLGKVVGQRLKMSDGLLRYMISREDRRGKGVPKTRIATQAEVDRALRARLLALPSLRDEQQRQALQAGREQAEPQVPPTSGGSGGAPAAPVPAQTPRVRKI